jgi:hypothetical protein
MREHKIPNSERSKLFLTNDIVDSLRPNQHIPDFDKHYDHFFYRILETISEEFPEIREQIKANSEEKGLSGIAMIAAYGTLNGQINIVDEGKEISAQDIVDRIDKKSKFGGIILQLYTQGVSSLLVTNPRNQQLTSDNAIIVVPGVLMPFEDSYMSKPGETCYNLIEPGHFEAPVYKKPVERVDRLFR